MQAVKKNPVWLLSPAMMALAIKPATNPIKIFQIMCMIAFAKLLLIKNNFLLHLLPPHTPCVLARNFVNATFLLYRITWAKNKGATRTQLLVDIENIDAVGYYQHLNLGSHATTGARSVFTR